MAGTEEYLKNYGGISFLTKPFCEADNVLFGQISYVQIEKVISDDFDAEPVPFQELAERMFEYNGRKNPTVGVVLPKTMNVRLQQMANYKRYKELKVIACTETFDVENDVQFAAMTFLLPTNQILVIFRGTDDSITGWKEDLDIYANNNIPSYPLAVKYLETVAEKFEGDIIVEGHSKGGNLALYAALNCNQQTRDRIHILYNNDGPGFADYSLFSTEAYKELLPRYAHLVPESSFIGMLLCHDDDYTVVKSNKVLGPMQHDLFTWLIDESTGELVKVQKLSKLGKITDMTLFELLFSLDKEQIELVHEVIDGVADGLNQVYLLNLVKNVPSSFKGAREVWRKFDDDTKKKFKSAFKDIKSIIKNAYSKANEDAVPGPEERNKTLTSREQTAVNG